MLPANTKLFVKPKSETGHYLVKYWGYLWKIHYEYPCKNKHIIESIYKNKGKIFFLDDINDHVKTRIL